MTTTCLIYLESTQTLINQGLQGITTAEFGNGDRSLWEGLPQFMEMVTAVFGHGYNENWERKPQFMGSSWNLTGCII